MTQPDRSESLEWWLDWINVLIGMMADAHLRGVVELDPVTANFEIQQNSNTDFTGPYHLLQNMLERKDPGGTRGFYHRWTRTPRMP